MIEFMVRHRATVFLVVVCLFLFGSSAYVSLPRESAPDVEVPFVMVSTPYVGVAPKDIESLITTPIESELSGLKDLKKMSSISAEGVSLISLEFEPEVEISEVLQRVRDRVARARPDLPMDADETEVQEISFADFPILIVTLAGAVDDVRLKALAEDLQDVLERVPGVLDAKISGGRTREVHVDVDPHRLTHYGLSLNDVTDAIKGENVNIPGGDVNAGSAAYLVRVPGDVKEAAELENVAIKRIGDRPVFVRDVATVKDGFKDRETYSRMNGQDSISISVSKRAGANILDLATNVKQIVAEQAKTWPKAVEYRVLGDQSKYVRDMVNELENNIIVAMILVVGVIMLFMGMRNSLFVALAIPLSMLSGILWFAIVGTTLNMVVLFALILVLGMLVDNAIVLVENIYRHVEMGKGLVEASVDGAREIAGAVVASTLTTVAAFFPLLFWTGLMGEFMVYLPQTVVLILMASLAVAVLILPVMTARWMKPSTVAHAQVKNHPVLRAYRSLLELALRFRVTTALLLFGSLVGTFVAYAGLNHGVEFFPDIEPDRAFVSVRAPDGTSLEATDKILRQVEKVLSTEPDVDVFVAEAGVTGGGDPLQGSQSASNMARITLDFLPHRTKADLEHGERARKEDARVVIARLRQKVETIIGAEISVEKERMGPPVGKPVAVEVSGENFYEVGALAGKLKREIAKLEGVTDLKDDYRVGRPEMRLRVDRGAAKRVGASTQAVAASVRTAISGTTASTLRDGEDEYDIVVRLAPRYRDDLEAVSALTIPGREDTSPETFAVPLSAVASYELAGGTGAIRHIDQKLVVTISGDVSEGVNENDVRARVAGLIDKTKLAPGFGLRLGGADDEQRKTEEFLGRAFAIGVFLILFVLVSQFNRFDLPLIILGSVVLSLVGVLWGLILTGTAFGVVMTGVGVISLAGVVVNNAIVLLDYIEQLRREGVSAYDAIIDAGVTRFRPVMLTAITTILGLVPMAIGLSIDIFSAKAMMGTQSGAWWGPMAVAVIFGLAFATILTLIFVPVAYSLFESIRQGSARIYGRIFRSSARAPQKGVEAGAE